MDKIAPSSIYFLLTILSLSILVVSQASNNGWITDAHATFYGDIKGGETMCKSFNILDLGFYTIIIILIILLLS